MNKVWKLTWTSREFNTIAGTEFHDTFMTPFGYVIRFTYPNGEKRYIWKNEKAKMYLLAWERS